jgi:flagellar basal-body rod protein FlgB
MIGKLDAEFRFQETALSVRAQRQQLLASNIANADTPHYKARDVDFTKALQNALGTESSQQAVAAGSVEMAKTSANHLSSSPTAMNVPGTIGGLEPQYRSTIQGSVDDNTVDMDKERNEFTDNALRYEASITLMTAEMKKMLTAIQGQ